MAGPNNWEFLLQQEGDRSWLPLESPDVEILEGRYRVMVKTAVPDTVMDIRITHESTDEFPIKRRTQVRSGETSAKGLLLVIPFTQMQPGVWELAIGVPHNENRDDARGATQHYSVQLHVLTKESDVAGEWEPDWSQPEPDLKLASKSEPILEPSPELNPEPNVAVMSSLADPVNPSQILPLDQQEANLFASLEMPDESEQDLTTAEDDLFASLDGLISELPTVQPELPSESIQVVESSPVVPMVSPPIVLTVAEPIAAEPIAPDPSIDRQTITLSLQPNSYEIQAEQTIVVEGIVQANSSGSLPECSFVVRVRDPQQGDLVVERSTPFTLITLPFDMQLGLQLPTELPASSMLMGEVCLMDDRTGDTLAIDRFTLFAPLSDLLATMQDLESQTRSPVVDELPHPPAEPSGPELDDQFLGLVNQPATSPTSFQVQPKSQLPPKLYQPDQNRDDRPSPSLPTFLTAPTPEADIQDLFDDFAIDDDVMVDEFSFDDPTQLEDSQLEDAILENTLTVPSDVLPEVLPEENLLLPVPALASSETISNEGDDRFDDGLEAAFLDNDLDLDDYLDLSQSEFAFNTSAPLDLDDPDDLLTIDINAQQITDRSPSDDRFESLNLGDRFMDRMSAFAEETKTESINAIPPTDAPSINPFASTRGGSSSAESVVIMDDVFNIGPATLDTDDNPLLIGADELVPTPSLEIEAVDEVVAGQSLMVKVKLPMIQPKLYVKLWINDRQTRTLLDGPRYLVDFVPDAQYRSMEATTTFTVPLGSLEIQIEAIAIETATKREGYKVSSPLAVVPPNLPGLGMDDFNF
jgi:hypothetical protein